ncbi:MAG: (2Fe-2S)-binding protein [Sphaerobacter sp.]|nr:(2Fe-2S)-binding protein [Sphaerobacter sp.]
MNETSRDAVCICRCEEVSAAAIRQAIAEGASTLDDVKRRTRAGMGLCQGIYCLSTVAAMLQEQAGIAPEEIAPMTARPPARVIPLAALAALED